MSAPYLRAFLPSADTSVALKAPELLTESILKEGLSRDEISAIWNVPAARLPPRLLPLGLLGDQAAH